MSDKLHELIGGKPISDEEHAINVREAAGKIAVQIEEQREAASIDDLDREVTDRLHSPDHQLKKFKKGARVRKIKGSSWQGNIVGFYSTALTPIGYAVESENESGSVQIYPEAALELVGE